MSEALSRRALTVAESKIGSPYLFGAKGPESFDCSGLVTFAFEQAAGGGKLFEVGGDMYSEADVASLYGEDTEPISLGNAQPGDLVFFTEGEGVPTHVGLFVSRRAQSEITFVNASSYFGKVVEDTWSTSGETRGQNILSIGRLLLPAGSSPVG